MVPKGCFLCTRLARGRPVASTIAGSDSGAAMDAYVYLKQVSPASLQRLLELLGVDRARGAIRALGVLTGEYDAIAFVEAERLEGIRRVVRDVIRCEAGILRTKTSVARITPARSEN